MGKLNVTVRKDSSYSGDGGVDGGVDAKIQ